MIRVVVIDREGKQRSHHFSKREVTVGAGDKSDVVLEDEKVSKHHLRIVEKQGKHVIFDLKSENGVFINRRRINSPQVVSHRDEIRIGPYVLRVSDSPQGVEVEA